MLRDSTQLAEICRALCALAGQHDLWTGSGPTEKAVQWVDGNPLSTGERVLFGVAWAIWGGGVVDFGDLVYRLDGSSLKAVGALLMAFSTDDTDHLDAWLGAYGAPTLRPVRGPE